MDQPVSTDPEDIKAAIRKKFKSMAMFEREHALSSRSVTDVLLGRRRPFTAQVIADALGHSVEALFPGVYESAVADDSDGPSAAHRLNAAAR